MKVCQVIEEPSPMDVEITPPAQSQEPPELPEAKLAPSEASPAKKKKKKASYKSVMAGMINCSGARDVEKEKEQLRKVTGGGAFSKIDKI